MSKRQKTEYISLFLTAKEAMEAEYGECEAFVVNYIDDYASQTHHLSGPYDLKQQKADVETLLSIASKTSMPWFIVRWENLTLDFAFYYDDFSLSIVFPDSFTEERIQSQKAYPY